MPDQREVIESPLDQGAAEALAYRFDFSGAGVSAIEGVPVCQVIRSDSFDVSSTTMPSGAGSVSGTIVTTPIVSALEADRYYRLYCRATHDGGQVCELFCTLRGRA